MKKFLVFLLLITLLGCSNKKEMQTFDEIETLKTATFTLDTSFTLSFWIRPIRNAFYTKVVNLCDDHQTIEIYNNTQDENWKSCGLTVCHENGKIYGDNRFELIQDNYSNIILTIKGKDISLYLDGQFVNKGKINEKLKRNLTVSFSENVDVSSLSYFSYLLNDEEIKNEFNKNAELKLESLNYSDELANNAYGEVALLKLPYPVEYRSDSQYIEISDTRFIFKQNNTDSVISVKVEALAQIKDEEYTKEFTFTIQPNTQNVSMAEAMKKILNGIYSPLSESDKLETIIDEYAVTYKVISGNAFFDENLCCFIKNKEAKEKENITIEINISNRKETISEVISTTLLDEYAGYVLAYFNGSEGWPDYEVGEETVYFAYSDDLESWTMLNTIAAFTSEEGSGRFRDPFIARDTDGNFVILTTEGYYNPGIYVIRSNNLIDFEVNHAHFNDFDSFLKTSGTITWAPEYIWSNEMNCYVLLFADGNKESTGLYAVTTDNFKEFSYPELYLDVGYPIIDPHIEEMMGSYYLFFKDETGEQTNICYAVSDTLIHPDWHIYDKQSLSEGSKKEGPFVLYDYDKEEYRLYLDGYNELKVYSGTVDFNNEYIETKLMVDDSFKKLKDVRHFSIIPITSKEKDALLAYWQ